MPKIKTTVRHTFLTVAAVFAFAACSVEERDELSPEDRAAALKVEEANDVLFTLEDCMMDFNTCVAAAGTNPIAVAQCAAEAAECSAEAGSGVPLPPGTPPLPPVPDIDLQPIADCHDDLDMCTAAASSPTDIANCLADMQMCLSGATGGICDTMSDLCMSLPIDVPECDLLDSACS